MRITREEKEKLREKILEGALPSLKNWGVGLAPVDRIMKEVGLTSGALYSHFDSKEDFFVQVVLKELDRVIELRRKEIEIYGEGAIPHLLESYLSDRHIKGVEKGCVFVALSSDMHRYKPQVRGLFEAKIELLFEVLSEGFPRKLSKIERLEKARFAFSALVGALGFARIMKTEKQAREFLNSTRNQLLRSL